MASIAATYARAFADVVLDTRADVNRALAGVRGIAELFTSSDPLRRVWENPAVPADQKHHLLDAIVQRESADKIVRNLVAVLINHRRVAFLPAIAEQVEKELNARMGFADAQVASARELGEAERRALEGQLEKVTGKKVRAHYGLDPSLLGGAMVRVGSTIYDGSVKGQLDRIKEAISS